MAEETPFQPNGKTVLAVANGTSQIVSITADAPSNQLRFFVANATQVFVSVFLGAPGNLVASIPVVGTPAYGMPLPIGPADITLSGIQSGSSSNCCVAIVSTGPNITAQVYITPGEGIRG